LIEYLLFPLPILGLMFSNHQKLILMHVPGKI
jgi:hypothetical protein